MDVSPIDTNKRFTVQLGQVWNKEELELHFTSIFGGVAWPAKHPGFAVVVATNRFGRHFNGKYYPWAGGQLIEVHLGPIDKPV